MICSKCKKQISIQESYEHNDILFCYPCIQLTDAPAHLQITANSILEDYLASMKDHTLRGLILSCISGVISAFFLFRIAKQNSDYASAVAVAIGVLVYFLYLAVMKRPEKGLFKTGEVLIGILLSGMVSWFAWIIVSIIIAIVQNPDKIQF